MGAPAPRHTTAPPRHKGFPCPAADRSAQYGFAQLARVRIGVPSVRAAVCTPAVYKHSPAASYLPTGLLPRAQRTDIDSPSMSSAASHAGAHTHVTRAPMRTPRAPRAPSSATA
eukprot:CAMPEP_0177629012 /NCGR_PEP_ID=MMETSP0447-20121125/437_1 /TAXON_ID=0 /ORGANISM="Stygamoeba regulata, Strain BSH-02190019" /LENGTH=113 /DNA_ID=CAMNT_0019130297 /DNA_START=360 /DNA_END=701 /DNA_ORIENTATION=-